MNYAIQFETTISEDSKISSSGDSAKRPFGLICFYDEHLTIEYPFFMERFHGAVGRVFETRYEDIADSRYDDADELFSIKKNLSSEEEDAEAEPEDISIPMSYYTAERIAGVLNSFKVNTTIEKRWY